MKRKMLCESEATVGEFQGLRKCAGADLLRFQIVFLFDDSYYQLLLFVSIYNTIPVFFSFLSYHVF